MTGQLKSDFLLAISHNKTTNSSNNLLLTNLKNPPSEFIFQTYHFQHKGSPENIIFCLSFSDIILS